MLRTEFGQNALEATRPLLLECIAAVSQLPEVVGSAPFDAVDRELARVTAQSATDPERDDVFVLRIIADFVGSYRTLWSQIVVGEYEASWCTLQDCLDELRLVKRFSGLSVDPFEDQLLQLEAAYPYTVFFSMGATVERFDCSICGQDIDSPECPHRRGLLYGGVLAHGVAKKITDLDHVSMVTVPKDKRCVVTYGNDSQAFQLLRHIADLVSSGRMKVRDFVELRWSKRVQTNPSYRRLGRNDPCFCGSTKKFKRCCENKQQIEIDHVDVVGGKLSYSGAFGPGANGRGAAQAGLQDDVR